TGVQTCALPILDAARHPEYGTRTASEWRSRRADCRKSGGVSAAEQRSTLPLDGIRVLELGHIVAGPSAGLILGDLGADVCKVEDPRTGDTARNQANQGTTFFSFNRNKRSIALDLRTDAGRDVFGKL